MWDSDCAEPNSQETRLSDTGNVNVDSMDLSGGLLAWIPNWILLNVDTISKDWLTLTGGKFKDKMMQYFRNQSNGNKAMGVVR